MKSSIENFESLYEEQNNFNSNDYSNLIQNSLSLPNFNVSSILNSKLTDRFHCLCKNCGSIPIIEFLYNTNQMNYICQYPDSPKKLLIKEVFGLLFDKINDIDKIKLNVLKCLIHPNEKNYFYCKTCEKNICNKCLYENENYCNHENKIVLSNDRNTIKKIKYIIEKIEQNNKSLLMNDKSNILSDSDENMNDINNNISKYRIISHPYNNNNENKEYNNNIAKNSSIHEEYCEVLKVNNDINTNMIDINEREEIFDIFDKINNGENYDNEQYIDLLSIFIFEYINYPNYNLLKNISNAEKFAILLFKDFNKINLKYDINEKNIKDDSIKLFKDIFVNNNKENCFLLINEKILELSDYIKISDILGIKNNMISNWPFQLEVKLIERKNNPMTDLSFMFYGISSLNSESNFADFDTINITTLSYMFCNCSSLKKLPDISNFNTTNVKYINYMFYNCSSLKELPDISKWNTENVREINYIFYGCESLEYLPDISEWNITKIESMNYMLKNCKSLKKLFNTNQWEKNISKNAQKIGVLEGCTSLESKDITNNSLKNNILKYISKFINILFSIFYWLFIIFILLLYVLLLVLAVFFPIRAIYYSFNLTESNKCINNPNEYFNSINIANYRDNSNINRSQEKKIFSVFYGKLIEIANYTIDYLEDDEQNNKKINLFFGPFIQKIVNISEEFKIEYDSFLKKELGNNPDNTIEVKTIQDNKINITLPDEEVHEFKLYQKYFIVLTLINVISSFSFIILLLCIYLFSLFANMKIYFIMVFVFIIISIISGLINNYISDKMYSPYISILDKIENVYGIEIPQVILKEKNNINECKIVNTLIVIVFTFFFLAIIFYFCRKIRKNINKKLTESESIQFLPNNKQS